MTTLRLFDHIRRVSLVKKKKFKRIFGLQHAKNLGTYDPDSVSHNFASVSFSSSVACQAKVT